MMGKVEFFSLAVTLTGTALCLDLSTESEPCLESNRDSVIDLAFKAVRSPESLTAVVVPVVI